MPFFGLSADKCENKCQQRQNEGTESKHDHNNRMEIVILHETSPPSQTCT
ncbi:hypothetical protein SDC9_149403 [bioreactor metagenome]|uniref:Uncharacterized protein n=1 Tax=bioreactor metagenome TaxID=1076179 RepID=A0A645EM41_9ZZZZ